MDIEPIQCVAPSSHARNQVVTSHSVGAIDDDFSEFYRLEHDGQVRRAYLILGASGPAHDVVAEAFVAVFRRWGSIERPGPYLNRCVLNGCRDVHRRAPREQPLRGPTDSLYGANDRDRSQRAAVDHVGHVDDADELAEQLLILPFRQRAAVVLRYYGGYSEADIAHYLDCRPGTVGSLIHRALRALRESLDHSITDSPQGRVR